MQLLATRDGRSIRRNKPTRHPNVSAFLWCGLFSSYVYTSNGHGHHFKTGETVTISKVCSTSLIQIDTIKWGLNLSGYNYEVFYYPGLIQQVFSVSSRPLYSSDTHVCKPIDVKTSTLKSSSVASKQLVKENWCQIPLFQTVLFRV